MNTRRPEHSFCGNESADVMTTNRSLNQAEMERRVEADDGCPETTVYVRVVQNGNKRSEGYTYHEDPDCQYLKNSQTPNEYSRKGAQLRWRAPCLDCTLLEYHTQNL